MQLLAWLLAIWPSILLLCFNNRSLHVHAVSSYEQSSTDKEPFQVDATSYPTREDRDHYWDSGGNDAVHDVWSVLRDLEPTWRDGTLRTQSNGVVGTLWYYIKAVFRLLFMNIPSRPSEVDNHMDQSEVRGDLAHAVEVLKYGAHFDDPDALFLLGEMNFHGNFSHPRDFQKAFQWYSDLASLDGNSTAQYMVGLMYGTGIGGAVNRDQAKALVYHTFAADQGNVRSEMTCGYRHHQGIGTPRNCDEACRYYKRVADKAMAYWHSGPPGGMAMLRNSYRWAEEYGGVYGEGASASSAGHNAPDGGRVSVADALEFWEMKERQGDFSAMFNLGRHYYNGNRGYRRNMKKAQKQFMKIARAYWAKDGRISSKAPKGIERIAGKAAAYLGRMALRGEGVEQNFEKAIMWFRRGINEGDAYCQYHLGLMHRDGLGWKKDGMSAATLLKAAAEQHLHVAQSALGVLFLDQGDIDAASRYFELAANADVMEGYYYLAELFSKGVGRERNCATAVSFYKIVAERVEMLHSAILEANTAYAKGDTERALVAAVMAAEQGYEHAQSNVAYILDDKTSSLSFLYPSRLISYLSNRGGTPSTLIRNPELALIYYTRSARQLNADSLVKLGDYYLSGFDTDSADFPPSSAASVPIASSIERGKPNPDKASSCYSLAADSYRSAQGLWNLGWMHENGIAPLAQDFHMAKRYYDLALEINKEAYLPTKLALGRLRLRSWWNGVSGGTVNMIREEEKEKKKWTSFGEWVAHFLDQAEQMDAEEVENERRAVEDDLQLSHNGDANEAGPMPGGDDEHYFASAEAYDDIFDDGLVESLIIIGLAATLAMLVYWRQVGRLEGRRRQQQQQQQQQPQQPVAQQAQDQQQHQPPAPPQGGLFPNPGDPAYGQWVAGGVGH